MVVAPPVSGELSGEILGKEKRRGGGEVRKWMR